MAEIEFERKGLPLWKVLLALLGLGGAAWGGYEAFGPDDRPATQTTEPVPPTAPAAPATSPSAPAGTPAAAPATP